MSTVTTDHDRDQRRAGKVHRRNAPATEEELTLAIEHYLHATPPPTDLSCLMAWGARCAELVQRPGGWRFNRGLEGVERSLTVFLRGDARVVVGAHLTALVIRHGQAVGLAFPRLCVLAFSAVRELAATNLPDITVALERYGAGEGMAALLQSDPEWLPLVLQCFLAGVVVPAVVGQQLLQMTRFDNARLTPIIMECFRAHRQTYQAALIARELLVGPAWRQAVEVLYEAVVAGDANTDRVLLSREVLERLRHQKGLLDLDRGDPMVAVMHALLQRAAAAHDFSIANYFITE